MRLPLGDKLRHSLGRYIPFLRTPAMPRQVVFQYRPVRNDRIEWETTDAGEALLKVPRRKDRVGNVFGSWFRVPETRGVQLDEVGTYVWSLCDGSNTVESIVKQTSREYKMNRREVEISVTQYLQMLAERNFIGFYQRSKPRGRKGESAR